MSRVLFKVQLHTYLQQYHEASKVKLYNVEYMTQYTGSNIKIIRKDKGNSHLRMVWKNVEE